MEISSPPRDTYVYGRVYKKLCNQLDNACDFIARQRKAFARLSVAVRARVREPIRERVRWSIVRMVTKRYTSRCRLSFRIKMLQQMNVCS